MIKSSAVIEAVTSLDMEVVNEVYQFMEETHYFCTCAVQLDVRENSDGEPVPDTQGALCCSLLRDRLNEKYGEGGRAAAFAREISTCAAPLRATGTSFCCRLR